MTVDACQNRESNSPKAHLERMVPSRFQFSNEKRGPWLFIGYIVGGKMLPRYAGIIANHEIRIPIEQPV